MKPITVLALFDGMACGLEALKRAGIPVKKYYASEIDQHAIKIASKNHPEIIHLGDVQNWKEWDIDSPDLVIGGSPCQGFSFVGKQLAFDDPRSRLFFTMKDIIDNYKPANYLLENVKMAQKHIDVINEILGQKPILLNSALLSAQGRNRLYWFNWDSPTPKETGILTDDIIDKENQTPNSEGWQKWWLKNSEFQLRKKYSCILNDVDKAICMTARQVSSWNGNMVRTEKGLRFLSPMEAERLQTLPDNYTAGVSNTQRYKMIGNGWTVDVIAHLFKSLEEVL